MSVTAARADRGPSWTTYLGTELLGAGRQLARLMLAGALIGVFTTGVLSRLAMRLLAVVNGDVRGILSDDGFFIGEMSLVGTLELAFTGVLLGALSGLLYAVLSPLQVGPRWFRTLSISVGAGVVVASVVIHSDGVDFTFLQPPWLTVGLFVLIPVVHVALLDLVGRRVKAGELMRSRPWPVAGLVPLLLLAPFVAVVGVLYAAVQLARRDRRLAPRLAAPGWGMVGRIALTVVFALAVLDLARDVVRIS